MNNSASSEARKATALAISSGFASAPRVNQEEGFENSSGSMLLDAAACAHCADQIGLDRTGHIHAFSGDVCLPTSRASDCVNPITPPLRGTIGTGETSPSCPPSKNREIPHICFSIIVGRTCLRAEKNAFRLMLMILSQVSSGSSKLTP